MLKKKKCPACKLFLLASEFHLNASKADGLGSQCRKCTKVSQHKWYVKNKERHKKNVATRDAIRSKECRKKVVVYLWAHPCVDCGEDDPIVLEFDHVRGEKVTTISKMVGESYSWPTIEAEIAKCEVRCANCHRRKTAKERGWDKNYLYQ